MKTTAHAATLSAGNEENDHLLETSNGAATVLHEAAWPLHLQMINLTMLTAISTFFTNFLSVTAGNTL